jgi:hypothetical protein
MCFTLPEIILISILDLRSKQVHTWKSKWVIVRIDSNMRERKWMGGGVEKWTPSPKGLRRPMEEFIGL